MTPEESKQYACDRDRALQLWSLMRFVSETIFIHSQYGIPLPDNFNVMVDCLERLKRDITILGLPLKKSDLNERWLREFIQNIGEVIG